MNNTCAVCNQAIITNRSIKCSMCAAHHHHICVNAAYNGDTNKLNDTWLCPSCRPHTPLTANTSSPVSMRTTPAELDVSHVNTQSRAHKRNAIGSPGMLDDLEDSVSFSALVSEIRYMRLDMTEVKDTLKLLCDGMEKCNARLDSYEARIHTLEQNNANVVNCIDHLENFGARINVLEENNSQVASLHETIANLKDQMNQQMQSAMRNEIEIIGIEESNNENLHHTVLITAAKLGVQLNAEDIDWTSRAGLKKTRNLFWIPSFRDQSL